MPRSLVARSFDTQLPKLRSDLVQAHHVAVEYLEALSAGLPAVIDRYEQGWRAKFEEHPEFIVETQAYGFDLDKIVEWMHGKLARTAIDGDEPANLVRGYHIRDGNFTPTGVIAFTNQSEKKAAPAQTDDEFKALEREIARLNLSAVDGLFRELKIAQLLEIAQLSSHFADATFKLVRMIDQGYLDPLHQNEHETGLETRRGPNQELTRRDVMVSSPAHIDGVELLDDTEHLEGILEHLKSLIWALPSFYQMEQIFVEDAGEALRAVLSAENGAAHAFLIGRERARPADALVSQSEGVESVLKQKAIALVRDIQGLSQSFGGRADEEGLLQLLDFTG